MEEQKQAQENESSDKQKLMCYWGYRFETLSTLSKPPHKVTKGDIELQQRLKDSANTNIQYCILVKTKLGDNSIIMGAEVDCCRGKYNCFIHFYYYSCYSINRCETHRSISTAE